MYYLLLLTRYEDTPNMKKAVPEPENHAMRMTVWNTVVSSTRKCSCGYGYMARKAFLAVVVHV